MKSQQSAAARCGKSRATSGERRQNVLRPQQFSSTLAFTGARLDYAAFDADYLARLKSRDPATEQHFFSYFSNAIWLKLRNRVRARHLIDEIRQETLTRVLGNLQSGKIQSPERFGGYVLGVCNNVMLEVMRSEFSRRQPTEDPVDPPDKRVRFDADIVNEQRKQLVREILNDLPEKDRKILWMVYLEEAERSVICSLFDVDNDYLRVLLHRAKERFRELARKRGLEKELE
jgi:RNA polymerase sigma-70 factor, ECF subfamily